MQEIKYELYIGSNNETKELEKGKAIGIISEWYPSFTVSEVVGYWKGTEERTLRVEIMTSGDEVNDFAIRKLTKELEKELNQEKVLVVGTLIKTNF
jgi:hypothetical protein